MGARLVQNSVVKNLIKEVKNDVTYIRMQFNWQELYSEDETV